MTHVLLVDGDPAVRRAIRRLLERFGCRVTEARGDVAALAMLRAAPADVLLTDTVRSGEGAFAGLLELRRELYPSMRIVAMSASGMSGAAGYLQAARSFGPVSVLLKPFNAVELAAALGIPGATTV